jgi:hypothetical protein
MRIIFIINLFYNKSLIFKKKLLVPASRAARVTAW